MATAFIVIRIRWWLSPLINVLVFMVRFDLLTEDRAMDLAANAIHNAVYTD